LISPSFVSRVFSPEGTDVVPDVVDVIGVIDVADVGEFDDTDDVA
jgi:hypothetical protein